MHLLLDSDSLCYQAGYSANGEGQESLAIWQLNNIIDRILQETSPDSHKLYLTGSANFRYHLYPAYKANRIDTPRPLHLQSMREHLVVNWNATMSDGNEADDEIGIASQTSEDMLIGHLDKDLNMLPGKHYNYKKQEWFDVNELEGMRHFFWQLIMGDKGDNIPGFDGLMRQKVPKKLEHHMAFLYDTESYDDMLAHVFEMYNEDWPKFNLSAQCLWIQRKENDDWRNWQNPELIQELITVGSGQPEDLIPLSHPSFEVDHVDGVPNSAL